MKYEKTSFWWGFVGGASAAYAFIFMIIFAVAIAIKLTIGYISLILLLISGIFTLLIIFGKVMDKRSTSQKVRTRPVPAKKVRRKRSRRR